ncbi:MAG: hypothetical protein SWK90_10305 [Chloroflexota bacterium]|nr:hypothetical protein [Chloroflexota bacterium]
MHTIILRNVPHKRASGTTFTIAAIGESQIVEAVKRSINKLEHHPAKMARRSLVDLLSIIEKHDFQIRYTEHTIDDDGLESWLFVLQK